MDKFAECTKTIKEAREQIESLNKQKSEMLAKAEELANAESFDQEAHSALMSEVQDLDASIAQTQAKADTANAWIADKRKNAPKAEAIFKASLPAEPTKDNSPSQRDKAEAFFASLAAGPRQEQSRRYCEENGVYDVMAAYPDNPMSRSTIGALNPEWYSTDIDKWVAEYALVARYCKVEDMPSATAHVPKRTGGLTAYKQSAENTGVTDSASTYGTIKLEADQWLTSTYLSNQSIKSSTVDLLAELMEDAGLGFAHAYDNEALNGTDGTGGILTNLVTDAGNITAVNPAVPSKRKWEIEVDENGLLCKMITLDDIYALWQMFDWARYGKTGDDVALYINRASRAALHRCGVDTSSGGINIQTGVEAVLSIPVRDTPLLYGDEGPTGVNKCCMMLANLKAAVRVGHYGPLEMKQNQVVNKWATEIGFGRETAINAHNLGSATQKGPVVCAFGVASQGS